MEDKLLIGGIVFVISAIIYFTHKSYPIDYVNGKILVDPKRMIRSGYSNMGGLLGFCVARFVERQWIKFRPIGPTKKGVIICLIGLIPLLWMIQSLPRIMVGWCGPYAGRLLGQGLWMFYIVAFFPFLLKCFFSKKMSA